MAYHLSLRKLRPRCLTNFGRPVDKAAQTTQVSTHRTLHRFPINRLVSRKRRHPLRYQRNLVCVQRLRRESTHRDKPIAHRTWAYRTWASQSTTARFGMPTLRNLDRSNRRSFKRTQKSRGLSREHHFNRRASRMTLRAISPMVEQQRCWFRSSPA